MGRKESSLVPDPYTPFSSDIVEELDIAVTESKRMGERRISQKADGKLCELAISEDWAARPIPINCPSFVLSPTGSRLNIFTAGERAQMMM